jgi:hypothetical protein
MTTLSLFEIINQYGAIVYGHNTNKLIVAYNGEHTFNIFRQMSDRWYQEDNDLWTAGDDNVKEMSLDDLYLYCKDHIRNSI